MQLSLRCAIVSAWTDAITFGELLHSALLNLVHLTCRILLASYIVYPGRTAPLACAGMLMNPESPTHLLQKGQYKAADSAGERLWGSSYKGELYGAAGSMRDSGKESMKGDLEEAGADVKDAGKQLGQSLKQGLEVNTEAEGARRQPCSRLLCLLWSAPVPGTLHSSPAHGAPPERTGNACGRKCAHAVFVSVL